jgi:hypothetical protein
LFLDSPSGQEVAIIQTQAHKKEKWELIIRVIIAESSFLAKI